MTDVTLPGAELTPSRAERFRRRTVPLILFALLLAVIPLFDPSRSMITLLNHIGITIVFALSFNMLLGRAGLLSFGHAVYMGLGGYFAVHVMNRVGAGTGIWAHVPIFSMPAFGFGAGALAGAVIGWPSCKRSGTPFAMISLGVAELVAAAGFMFDSLFGGEMGVSADRMTGPELFGLSLGPVEEVYWFVAFWTFIGVLGTYAFTRTPLGKLGEATRDNAERVQFVGFNPQRVRYLVFVFAGAFAGLAGGMSAVQDEIFTPENLSLGPSGAILIAAYVGGIRYFTGPIMGAIVMTWMSSNLSDYTAGWLLYLGLMFVCVVMFLPDGIAGIVYGTADTIRQGRLGAVWRHWLLRLAGLALIATSVITIVEVAFRWSDGYGEVFMPFGLALPATSPLTWAVGTLPLIAGIWLVRRAARGEST